MIQSVSPSGWIYIQSAVQGIILARLSERFGGEENEDKFHLGRNSSDNTSSIGQGQASGSW
jgi:hypothetical protein